MYLPFDWSSAINTKRGHRNEIKESRANKSILFVFFHLFISFGWKLGAIFPTNRMYETIGYLFSFRFKDIQSSFGRNHHGLLNTIKSFVVLKSGFPPGKNFLVSNCVENVFFFSFSSSSRCFSFLLCAISLFNIKHKDKTGKIRRESAI